MKFAQSMTFHRLVKYALGPDCETSITSSSTNQSVRHSATNIHAIMSCAPTRGRRPV